MTCQRWKEEKMLAHTLAFRKCIADIQVISHSTVRRNQREIDWFAFIAGQHWTFDGHSVVAQRISNWIRSRKIIFVIPFVRDLRWVFLNEFPCDIFIWFFFCFFSFSGKYEQRKTMIYIFVGQSFSLVCFFSSSSCCFYRKESLQWHPRKTSTITKENDNKTTMVTPSCQREKN